MSKQTAQNAIEILCNKNLGFRELHGIEKTNLALSFARKNMILYGQAFDLIKSKKRIDFTNEKEISNNLDSITVYEIKSTNRQNMSKDFTNYFFDLTTAELLVAQSLGDQYKFAFVNTITTDFIELTINQVFAKAKKVYPKWAIRF